MAYKKTFTLLFVTAITLFSIYLVPAFAATPGTWVGTVDFGKIELVVNADGTRIEKSSYDFSNWNCGPPPWAGQWGDLHPGGWEISDGAFSVVTKISEGSAYKGVGGQIITLTGAFESATHAAGTWETLSGGEECSGSWEASPPDASYQRLFE